MDFEHNAPDNTNQASDEECEEDNDKESDDA